MVLVLHWQSSTVGTAADMQSKDILWQYVLSDHTENKSKELSSTVPGGLSHKSDTH